MHGLQTMHDSLALLALLDIQGKQIEHDKHVLPQSLDLLGMQGKRGVSDRQGHAWYACLLPMHHA